MPRAYEQGSTGTVYRGPGWLHRYHLAAWHWRMAAGLIDYGMASLNSLSGGEHWRAACRRGQLLGRLDGADRHQDQLRVTLVMRDPEVPERYWISTGLDRDRT
jgi:hypothetical protein